MSNQIVISSGAKVRELEGVLTGTSGIVDALPINGSLGIPQLDINGKILVSQLPNSVMEYQGTWNATTNTPYLVNGVGNAGDVYLVSVAGTHDFGAGPISFVVSDQVIYSGTIWQKASGTSGTVTSVGVSRDGDALLITGSPVTTSGTINLGFNGSSTQYINGAGNLTTFPTLITSIGLSMPSAFSVSNSPLTANGTIAVTGAGYASQYIRGDGTLADFPSSGGGGSSVSYYLNGGTSQGTIGGVTYYEMSKTADTGTMVDFTKSGDGFIVAFLTDANDPAQLNIPAGNWNYEIYASMSSNGGTPQLYAELYVYNGTTFTLISTSSNEILYDGTNLNLYSFAMTVPATTLALTDRLAIKLYATNSGGKTTTVHTQDSHLCQVITTFSTGITALNGLTAQVQYFQTGTSGTDFNISSTTATHTFNIPDASATARGLITTGTQTIAGTKTFSDATKNNGGILLQNASSSSLAGYMNIGGLTNGVKFTSGGGISNNFTLPSATGYTFTFPNATGTIALTSDISYPVTSVFGRTGAVVATEGDYSLTQLSDVTITTPSSGQVLRYSGTAWVNSTETYVGTVTSVAMSVPTGLSVSGSPITTSGTLAVTLTAGYSIPTTASQTNWDTAYTNRITSATAPLSITSNVISISQSGSSANGYLSSTDWNTFNGKVGGGGTANYIPKFSGTFSIADSIIYDNSGKVLINTTDSSIGHRLAVYSATEAAQLRVMGLAPSVLFTESTTNTNSYSAYLGVVTSTNNFYTGSLVGDFVMSNNSNYGIAFAINNSQKLRIANTGAATFASSVTATSFVKTSGTSSQFLKADGSVDSSTYLTTSAAASTYLPLTGGTLTGALFGTTGQFSSSITSSTSTNASFVATTSSASGYSYIDFINTGASGKTYEIGIGGNGAASGYANNLYFDLAGVGNIMTLTSGRNVLIGTQTDSGYKLDVNGTGRFSGNLQLDASSPLFIANASNTGYFGGLSIRQSGTEKGRFAVNNSDGIYAYASTAQWLGFSVLNDATTFFRIASTGAATFSSSVQATNIGVGFAPQSNIGVFVYKSHATDYAFVAQQDGAGPIAQFSGSGGASRLYIASGGNVGIGTSSPLSLLHIASADTDQGIRLTRANGTYGIRITRTGQIQGKLSDDTTFQTAISLTEGNASGSQYLALQPTAGNVLIGTTDDGSGSKLISYSTTAATQIKAAGTAPAITFSNTITSPTIGGVLGAATGANQFVTGTAAGDMVLANQFSVGALIFGTNNTERVRITSGGDVLVGTTANTNSSKLVLYGGASTNTLECVHTGTADTFCAIFTNGNGLVGSIRTSGSGTSYYTTSDYRLKQDFKNYNGLNLISAIKTYDYEWKSDKSRMYGVVAHELQEVIPYAVSGEKDGELMQQVDYSKIVPILIKSIQEQQKEINELKLKIK